MHFISQLKKKYRGGGYNPCSDYYYFCDCVLRQEAEYYEDSHGNKIIGNYKGLKFVFSGFHSVIEIGENVQFQKTVFYIHNDSKIEIGADSLFQESVTTIQNKSKIRIDKNARFIDNRIDIHPSSKVTFGNKTYIKNNDVCVKNMAELNIQTGCHISNTFININRCAHILLEEKVTVSSNGNRKTCWNIEEGAKFKIGRNGRFSGQAGECFVGKNALLKVGTGFSINGNYRVVVSQGTSILIGDDCMFSYDVSMRSNDGHSIFDVVSKENINSTDDVNKNRGIVLGNHVWIGERACILYNTQIGNGSIIGAMSLVKSRIPNNCIVAGVPARVIKRNVAWSIEEGADDIKKCGQEYVHCTEEL